MSVYPTGHKSNTKGRHAASIPCIRCGAAVRVMRSAVPHAGETAWSACHPCGHSPSSPVAEVRALAAEIERDVIRPQIPALRSELRTAPNGAIEFHRRRLALWAEAVNSSLAARGIVAAAVA